MLIRKGHIPARLSKDRLMVSVSHFLEDDAFSCLALIAFPVHRNWLLVTAERLRSQGMADCPSTAILSAAP